MTAANEKRRRRRKKKLRKLEKPKDVGHFLDANFDFWACLSKNLLKRGASGKKGLSVDWSCFGSYPSLKSPKCPKTACILAKSPRNQ